MTKIDEAVKRLEACLEPIDPINIVPMEIPSADLDALLTAYREAMETLDKLPTVNTADSAIVPIFSKVYFWFRDGTIAESCNWYLADDWRNNWFVKLTWKQPDGGDGYTYRAATICYSTRAAAEAAQKGGA